jgi:endonuclease/exonuclease/phosphatase family metal-dependent hydrolase
MRTSIVSFLLAMLTAAVGCAGDRREEMAQDRVAPATALSSRPIRVMSFNIRTSTANDGTNGWQFRRDAMAAMIAAKDVDLFGLQEANRPQIDDLMSRVDGYKWIGIGRNEDGGGEYAPIFYRPSRLEVLDQGTFWLSESPEKFSRGWDAALPRIATWAKLRDVRTSRAMLLVNTHFDHRGEQARAQSAKLIMRRLPELSRGLPAVFIGDFNALPESDAYKTVTSGPAAMLDTRLHSQNGHTGPVETFTGFHGNNTTPRTIDYIFVSRDVGVRRTETVSDDWQGRQLSDHRAILADVELPAAGH